MEDRFYATFILHSLGDTIGFKNGKWEFNNWKQNVQFGDTNELLYEFIKLGGVNAIDLSQWNVSDDTLLHLATAEAFIDKSLKKLNIDTIGKILKNKYIFECNYSNMKNRYLGDTLAKYIRRLEKGSSWDSTPYDEFAGGSGASMKSSCLGLIFNKPSDLDNLIKYSIEISRMTHNNTTGYLGGLTSALFTHYAINNINIEKWGFNLIELLDSGKIDKYLKDTRGYKEYIRDKHAFVSKWKVYLDDKFENRKVKTRPQLMNIVFRGKYYYTNFRDINFKDMFIGSSGDDSVIIAYDCLLDSRNNWEKLIVYAMLHIGDTDTTGCISGSWYGALYGLSNIPKHMIKSLEFLDRTKSVASDIYKRYFN